MTVKPEPAPNAIPMPAQTAMSFMIFSSMSYPPETETVNQKNTEYHAEHYNDKTDSAV